jgi:hypothetical protein
VVSDQEIECLGIGWRNRGRESALRRAPGTKAVPPRSFEKGLRHQIACM